MATGGLVCDDAADELHLPGPLSRVFQDDIVHDGEDNAMSVPFPNVTPDDVATSAATQHSDDAANPLATDDGLGSFDEDLLVASLTAEDWALLESLCEDGDVSDVDAST